MTTTPLYTCPPSTEPELLLTEGATQLFISYQYELETSSEAAVAEAMERVEAAMLKSVAEQSGLVDCDGPGVHHPWRRLTGGGVEGGTVQREQRMRHRRLREGGRGSNSIVGLSSNPADEVSYVLCSADVLELATTRADPFNSTEREFTPGLAGSVVMGEELEESDEGDEGIDILLSSARESDEGEEDNDVILSSMRIDGGEVSIQRSIHRASQNNKAGSSSSDGDSNDNLELLDFHYISTQSLPIDRTSHTSHNPLIPPVVFQQRSQIKRPAGSLPSPSTLLIQPRSSKKCTVIQGHMSIYTSESGSSFENLEERIVDLLTQEVNTNGMQYTDDLIVGVRMYDNSDTPIITEDTIPQSPGYVTAIGKPSTQENSNSNNLAISTSMAILVALGCLLIVLVALFAHTSRPKQQEQRSSKKSSSSKGNGGKGGAKWVNHGSESSSVGTYRDDDDEVEMDIRDMEKDLHVMKSHDDYSVGEFSVSSAAASPGRKSLRSSARNTPKTNVDPASQPLSSTQTELTRAASSATINTSAASPIQSSYFGLFTARPRAISPECSIELDIQSVYDCDDGVASVDSEARVANLVASFRQPLPPIQEGDDNTNQLTTPTITSWFGSLFGAKPQEVSTENDLDISSERDGKKPVYLDGDDETEVDTYGGPVDLDALINDNNITTPSNRAVTPSFPPGCMGMQCNDTNAKNAAKSSLLRFFTARDQCNTLHSEVEASLRPFDDCSEYSTSVAQEEGRPRPRGQEVESNYFFGNCAAADDDDRMLLADQAGKSTTRLVRKFGKMLQRVRSSGGGDEGEERQEIHPHDEKDGNVGQRGVSYVGQRGVSRKPSPSATDVYTMQRKPSSLLRPIEFYKSPSALSEARRKGNVASRDAKEEEGEEIPHYVVADDESMTVYDSHDCWLPDCMR